MWCCFLRRSRKTNFKNRHDEQGGGTGLVAPFTCRKVPCLSGRLRANVESRHRSPVISGLHRRPRRIPVSAKRRGYPESVKIGLLIRARSRDCGHHGGLFTQRSNPQRHTGGQTPNPPRPTNSRSGSRLRLFRLFLTLSHKLSSHFIPSNLQPYAADND